MGALAFLAGGGEMGALIRAYDWAASPLGPPEHWPQGLKTSLRTALTTRHPIFIFWGPQHICFYNDGYRASLGPEKHPGILGARGRRAFDELWDIIGPQIDLVMRGEGATWHENHLVPSYRNGRLDEVYWTYSYGPIDDHTAPDGVGGVLVVCTETTEQVRNAAALRQLNERLEERVAEALAERKLLADIVEGTDAFMQAATLDYRWLAINPAAAAEFERIFGVTPRVGDSMLEVLDHLPEHREDVRAVWRRALQGEAYIDIQAFGDPGRARRFYEMRFRPLLDPAGERIGAYQIVYDVTERLQEQRRLAETEDQLRQAQKIETLGQLTGGVAHDFNNLLTPVMAALDFARLELRNDTEARELVWVGLKAADRARVLVQRLLAFSRRQHLQPRDVDVAQLVESMADMALRSLKPGIELVLDVAPGPLLARVDPDQLALAVLNLAVNARDAILGAGRVTIRAAPVRLDAGGAVAAGRYVRIDVVDDGHGMDEAPCSARWSLSSPPRNPAAAPGWACRRCRAWPCNPEAGSGWTARPARAPRRPCGCRWRPMSRTRTSRSRCRARPRANASRAAIGACCWWTTMPWYARARPHRCGWPVSTCSRPPVAPKRCASSRTPRTSTPWSPTTPCLGCRVANSRVACANACRNCRCCW